MKHDWAKHSLTYFFLLVAMVLVWFVGPSNMAIRALLCTVVAVIGWFYFSPRKKNLLSYGRLPKSMKKSLILAEKRFISAIEFLRTNNVKQQNFASTKGNGGRGKLFDLPWYLVIGPSGGGKSTLLTHSKLSILLSKKKKAEVEENPFKNHCQWWGTEQAVLMECNSNYFSHDKKLSTARVFWLTFLRLLQKYRRSDLNGVIVTLSLEDILAGSGQQQKAYFQSIKKRLLDIQKKIKVDLPVYVVFTKADCLSGFNEFFDTLTQQERAQRWGISFNRQNLATAQSVVDCFDTEFDLLLKRINERLLTRLQCEQEDNRRFLIKDFPLQVESLKKQFALLVKTIAEISTFKHTTKLRGIYLTSAEPKEETIDRLIAPLSKSFAVSTHVEKSKPVFQRNFFCEDLFHDAIFKDEVFFQPQLIRAQMVNKFATPVVVLVGCLFLGLMTSYWLGSLNEKVSAINHAQEKIAQYKLLAEQADFTKADQALPALNMLADTLSILNATSKNPVAGMGEGKHQQLIYTANEAYLDVMQVFLSAQLQGAITQQMTAIKGSPTDLYSALKTYLMVGLMEHFEQPFVTHWFNQFWQQQLSDNKIQVEQLNNHLGNYLHKNFKPIIFNQQLVGQARNSLRQYAPAEVVFAIIFNDLLPIDEKFSIIIPQGNGLHRFFDYPEMEITAPVIYSKHYFLNTYEKLIPEATNILQNGNWVLMGASQQFASIPTTYIIEESQKLYLSQYIHAWEGIISQLQINTFSSFEHAIQLIDGLSNAASHLASLVDTIHRNTDITYNNLQTPISIKFQKLNHLFNQYANGGVIELRANLLRLDDYLLNIANAKDPQHAAFLAALSRVQDKTNNDIFYQLEEQAITLPAPLNQWVRSIVENSWRLIIQDGQQYLNGAWQKSVIPQYNFYIKNRYPIQKDATLEISASHFNDFFGPSGRLNRFYTNLVKPFVDFSEGSWQWKKINNAGLELSDSVLEQFQRGVLIQNLFYPENSDKPRINFILKSKTRTSSLSSFIVDIDSQQAEFNNRRSAHFVWPGNMLMHSSTVTMTKNDGQKVSETETGLWSWFKLLDKTKLSRVAAPNKLAMQFNLDNNLMDFEIISTNIANPFSPDLLRAFQCPESLS